MGIHEGHGMENDSVQQKREEAILANDREESHAPVEHRALRQAIGHQENDGKPKGSQQCDAESCESQVGRKAQAPFEHHLGPYRSDEESQAPFDRASLPQLPEHKSQRAVTDQRDNREPSRPRLEEHVNRVTTSPRAPQTSLTLQIATVPASVPKIAVIGFHVA